jgi:hypothetical protein
VTRYSIVPLYYLSAECGNINPWFFTEKNVWRRKKSPAVPMLRMEISPKYEPAWEGRITQTITKRSISPIGPGQTLRSNALAKNNRNNNV